MASITATVSVRFRWWLKPYLSLVVLKARLTGRFPDMDMVEARVMKATITNIR